MLVFADAAEAAGRMTFTILLFAATVYVFIGYRRRRERGERATGWLVGLIVLGFLCLGAIANAANGG